MVEWIGTSVQSKPRNQAIAAASGCCFVDKKETGRIVVYEVSLETRIVYGVMVDYCPSHWFTAL